MSDFILAADTEGTKIAAARVSRTGRISCRCIWLTRQSRPTRGLFTVLQEQPHKKSEDCQLR